MNGLRTEQSKAKQNRAKKKKFPVELESIKLEFHWKKQSKIEQPLGLNRAFNIIWSRALNSRVLYRTRVYKTRVPLFYFVTFFFKSHFKSHYKFHIFFNRTRVYKAQVPLFNFFFFKSHFKSQFKSDIFLMELESIKLEFHCFLFFFFLNHILNLNDTPRILPQFIDF